MYCSIANHEKQNTNIPLPECYERNNGLIAVLYSNTTYFYRQ